MSQLKSNEQKYFKPSSPPLRKPAVQVSEFASLEQAAPTCQPIAGAANHEWMTVGCSPLQGRLDKNWADICKP